MAKIPAKDMDFAYNSVALEDEINSLTQTVTPEIIDVTAFSDVGPRRVEGNYDWSYDLDGFADFASGQGDATLFGQLGNGAAVTSFEPTGNTAGANDPNYDGSAFLASYSIKGAIGGPVTYSATLQGNTALTRATS